MAQTGVAPFAGLLALSLKTILSFFLPRVVLHGLPRPRVGDTHGASLVLGENSSQSDQTGKYFS